MKSLGTWHYKCPLSVVEFFPNACTTIMPKARRKHALHFTGPSRLPNIKTPSPHPKRAEGRGHCEKTELCILVCTDLSIVYISFRDCLARLNVGVLQKHPLDWVTKKRPLKIKVLIMLKIMISKGFNKHGSTSSIFIRRGWWSLHPQASLHLARQHWHMCVFTRLGRTW